MSCSPFTGPKKRSFAPPCDNGLEPVRPPTPIRIEGYDGPIVSGLTLCVEFFIGAEGGREGVKLEEQMLITEDGAERLSSCPME